MIVVVFCLSFCRYDVTFPIFWNRPFSGYLISYLLLFFVVVVDVAAAVVFARALVFAAAVGFCNGGFYGDFFLRLCCLPWWFLRDWFLR